MGKATGFIEFKREKQPYRPVEKRLHDWNQVMETWPVEPLKKQAARCMDCGIPFCHQGCPLGNLIPDWNDLVYRDQWLDAINRLHETNNFPEFTGTLCPAPCEGSCVLGINDEPVTIKAVELSIIDRAWENGWIKPQKAKKKTGKKVAIIGSGPAGLAAAQQLARTGHDVTVFERDNRIGGLLRYGIPEFKMEKKYLDRRLKQLIDEGIIFKTNCYVGENIKVNELKKDFDALLFTVVRAFFYPDANSFWMPATHKRLQHPRNSTGPLPQLWIPTAKAALGSTVSPWALTDCKDTEGKAPKCCWPAFLFFLFTHWGACPKVNASEAQRT